MRFVGLFVAAGLCAWAGQYATLKDGRTIILHDNGTWEEVAPRDLPTLAPLKPTPDAMQEKKIKIAQENPLSKLVVGRWLSHDGSISYDFRSDGIVRYTRDGEVKEERYFVENIDEKKRIVRVNIGENSRSGTVSWGGFFLDLKFSEDGNRADDLTTSLKLMTSVVLQRQP
ncbi:MAG: hypothetical protein K6347_07620 [Campylobacterales bacterium]